MKIVSLQNAALMSRPLEVYCLIESEEDFNTSKPIYKIEDNVQVSDSWSNRNLSVIFEKSTESQYVFKCTYRTGGSFYHFIQKRELNRTIKLCYKVEIEPYNHNQEPEDDCL